MRLFPEESNPAHKPAFQAANLLLRSARSCVML